MTRLAEYGDVGAGERACVTVCAEAQSPRVGTVLRVTSTAGFEPAGSVMRWTAGFHAVWFQHEGARHGRRYALTADGEAQARAHFASLTGAQP